jgi:hypothetical protein
MWSMTDHDFYDIVLPDGSTAGTKISFNRAEAEPVAPALWPRIWKRQLRLRSEDEFWRGLDGAPVAYDIPRTADPAPSMPDYLARHLHDGPASVGGSNPRDVARGSTAAPQRMVESRS